MASQHDGPEDCPMFEDMAHSPLPKGRAGQFGYHLPMTNMLMGYSKNQKA